MPYPSTRAERCLTVRTYLKIEQGLAKASTDDKKPTLKSIPETFQPETLAEIVERLEAITLDTDLPQDIADDIQRLRDLAIKPESSQPEAFEEIVGHLAAISIEGDLPPDVADVIKSLCDLEIEPKPPAPGSFEEFKAIIDAPLEPVLLDVVDEPYRFRGAQKPDPVVSTDVTYSSKELFDFDLGVKSAPATREESAPAAREESTPAAREVRVCAKASRMLAAHNRFPLVTLVPLSVRADEKAENAEAFAQFAAERERLAARRAKYLSMAMAALPDGLRVDEYAFWVKAKALAKGYERDNVAIHLPAGDAAAVQAAMGRRLEKAKWSPETPKQVGRAYGADGADGRGGQNRALAT